MSLMSGVIRTPADLGLAVRTVRTQQKVSATDLARRSGHSRDLLWRLESGRDVSSSAILDVLRALGCALQIDSAELPTLEEMRERFKEPD